MTVTRVVALVAAHDEEGRIGPTVEALLATAAIDEVVVVADGSGDRTAEEARGAGARVLASPTRRGKGGAIETALARAGTADVVLLVDGDVAGTAGEAEKLLEPVASGHLDLAIGRLPPAEGGGFGLVKRIAGWLIHCASGWRPDEPLSGQRAITREAFEACRPLAQGFGLEVAMTIDAVRLGFRVAEVPVAMTHRPTGRTAAGFAHRARQGLDILRAVLPRLLRIR